MKSFDLNPALNKLRALPAAQFFIVLGVSLVLLLAVDFFLIMRLQVGGMLALDRQSVKIKTDIATLTTNKQRMVQYRESLVSARLAMKDFKAMVHKGDEVSAVLKTISTLANEYDVKIDQMVPQKNDGTVLVKNEDGSYGSLAILIKARTGYHQLGRFLSRLEKDRIYWHLENMEIAANAADPVHHLVKMQMRVLVLGD
ncbi:MAG: type 4a pilus biogenesis protein PilO [Candidatus Omnitrophota bacterium]